MKYPKFEQEDILKHAYLKIAYDTWSDMIKVLKSEQSLIKHIISDYDLNYIVAPRVEVKTDISDTHQASKIITDDSDEILDADFVLGEATHICYHSNLNNKNLSVYCGDDIVLHVGALYMFLRTIYDSDHVDNSTLMFHIIAIIAHEFAHYILACVFNRQHHENDSIIYDHFIGYQSEESHKFEYNCDELCDEQKADILSSLYLRDNMHGSSTMDDIYSYDILRVYAYNVIYASCASNISNKERQKELTEAINQYTNYMTLPEIIEKCKQDDLDIGDLAWKHVFGSVVLVEYSE